jgi:probable addiction module antidote protein
MRALRNVAEALGGIGQVAKAANLNRETLYRTLSEGGNPELRSLTAILGAAGLRLSVKPLQRRRGRSELAA